MLLQPLLRSRWNLETISVNIIGHFVDVRTREIHLLGNLECLRMVFLEILVHADFQVTIGRVATVIQRVRIHTP